MIRFFPADESAGYEMHKARLRGLKRRPSQSARGDLAPGGARGFIRRALESLQ